MSNTDTDALVWRHPAPHGAVPLVPTSPTVAVQVSCAGASPLEVELYAARATIERLTREQQVLRHALLTCARMAEALKRPCGSDPEGGQALRNSQYQNISTTAHIALGTITGPNPIEQAVARERERCARICDTTPPFPFRPSIEAAHAIRQEPKA